VVTEFEVRLHSLSSVFYGAALHLGDDIARVLQAWRDFMPSSPDNLRWGFSLTIAPDAEAVPRHVRGLPVASASALWAGDLEEGRRCLDRVLSYCNPLAVTKKVMPFLELQTMADAEFPHGRRYYSKAGYFKSFTDQTIHTMVQALATIPSPTSQIELAYLGGAAARVRADETAFGDRSAPFVMNLLGNWHHSEDDAPNVAWVRDLFAKLRPAMVPGVYVNFMSGDEADRVPEAYHNRWGRLVEVKTHYDPENLFRMNQNIPPLKAVRSNSRNLAS
jgi:Berberine and berberine like